MTTKAALNQQELIAAIETAKPGIFECEELRCPEAIYKETEYKGNFVVSSARWYCSWHERCPICHGKKFKPPDLEWVLELLRRRDRSGNRPIIGPRDSEPVERRWHCEFYYYIEDSDTWKSITQYGPTPPIAALRVLLAVVEKEAK